MRAGAENRERVSPERERWESKVWENKDVKKIRRLFKKKVFGKNKN